MSLRDVRGVQRWGAGFVKPCLADLTPHPVCSVLAVVTDGLLFWLARSTHVIAMLLHITVIHCLPTKQMSHSLKKHSIQWHLVVQTASLGCFWIDFRSLYLHVVGRGFA